MKALLVSLALALFFTVGTASAGTSSDGDPGSGCKHYDKWKDT